MDNTFFPRRLAEERKARGYTQKQVADALGISDRTYSKWETGENEMDVSALCRLAEFYETSPAIFFPSNGLRTEGVREALGALEPGEAAQRWFHFHYEALMGMKDSVMAEMREDSTFYLRREPWAEVPEDPSEQRGQAPNSLTTFAFPNLAAIFAAGEDMNMSLLLEPAEQGFSWLVSQQAELGAIFRVLGMPGALPCLHFLLRQPNTDLFSVPYLAGKAGASEEEIDAFLEAALPLGLCVGQKVRRNGREERLFRTFAPLPLLGLFAAAKLLLRRDGANLRRYGHQIGSVTPPIYEKGENA